MSNIFPALRYDDAPAAIDWLCRAFGFEKLAVHDGPDGTVAHAELRLGTGVVMLGSAKREGPDSLGVVSPKSLGRVTGSIYVKVADADAHFAAAKKAGAEIVIPLRDTEYGSREYTARDPEGQLWSFGTYAPQV